MAIDKEIPGPVSILTIGKIAYQQVECVFIGDAAEQDIKRARKSILAIAGVLNN